MKKLLAALFVFVFSGFVLPAAAQDINPTPAQLDWCEGQRISETALELTREQLDAFFPFPDVSVELYIDVESGATQGCVYVIMNESNFGYFAYEQTDGPIRVEAGSISGAITNLMMLQVGALGSGGQERGYEGPAGFCIQNGEVQLPPACWAGDLRPVVAFGPWTLYAIYTNYSPEGEYVGWILRLAGEDGTTILDMGVVND